MKLVTFDAGQGPGLGALINDQIIDKDGAVVTLKITGLGQLANPCREEKMA